jgi:hypothetical protein
MPEFAVLCTEGGQSGLQFVDLCEPVLEQFVEPVHFCRQLVYYLLVFRGLAGQVVDPFLAHAFVGVLLLHQLLEVCQLLPIGPVLGLNLLALLNPCLHGLLLLLEALQQVVQPLDLVV